MKGDAKKACLKLQFQAMGQNLVLQAVFYKYNQVIRVNITNNDES